MGGNSTSKPSILETSGSVFHHIEIRIYLCVFKTGSQKSFSKLKTLILFINHNLIPSNEMKSNRDAGGDEKVI